MSYTSEQEEALRGMLKRAKSVSELERAWVLLTLAKRKSRDEVAEIFEVHVDTVDRWQTAFKREGVSGITDKPYPGNHHKLTREQKQVIKTTVFAKTPKDLRLSEKRFWTTKLLKQLIQEKFGVTYDSEATYRKLFYAFGFSCHKPGKHNRNQNPEAVERFRVAVKKRSDNTSGWAVLSW